MSSALFYITWKPSQRHGSSSEATVFWVGSV